MAIKMAKKVRGIVFIPLISKALGVGTYGVYVQVLVVTTMVAGISQLGLHSALVRYLQQAENRREKADLYYSLTVFATFSGLLTATAIFLLADHISSWTLGTNTHALVFRIGSLLVPLKIANMLANNYYRAEMRVKTYTLLDGVKTYAVVACVLFIFFVSELTLLNILATMIAIEAVFVTAVNVHVISKLGLAVPTFSNIAFSIRYAIPVMVSQISNQVLSRSDRVLLGFFLGPAVVGAYDIAYKLSSLLLLFVRPISLSLFPEFSRLWEDGQYDECRRYTKKGIRYFLLVGIPAIPGLFLVGPNLLPVLTTQSTIEVALPLLPVLGSGILLLGVLRLYSPIFFAAEKTTFVSVINLAGACLNILMNLVLIPNVGAMGAAITTLGAYGLTLSLIMVSGFREFDIRIDTTPPIKALVATAVMVAVVRLLALDTIVTIVLGGAVTYFVAISAVRGIRKSELEHVMSVIQNPR